MTAAVLVDSSRAQHLKAAAEARGYHVPRDFSIVAFQGTETVPFTGPRSDFYELGRKAVDLCVVPQNLPQVVRIKPTWNEGGTVGRAPACKK